MIRTTGLVAAGMFFALGVASAADRDQVSPESRAYFGFSFGGQKVAPRGLHYGLRIDHDARFLEGEVATPLMQFDFTRRGLSDARFNGLSVIKQKYRLQQSEEQAAQESGAEPAPIEEGAPADEGTEEAPAEGGEAAAEEGGFFSNMWGGVTGFFGGLFGGGDEEVAEEAAPAEEAPAESAEAPAEEAADGAFATYDVIDWSLLALGVAGVGLAASEVLQGQESRDLLDSDGDGISDGSDPSNPGVPCTVDPIPVIDPDGTPNGCDPNLFTGRQGGVAAATVDVRYQQWLDGDTGQMGDLVGH